MSVSVFGTARPSLSISTGVLAPAVASPATSTERNNQRPESCLAADPPTAKVEASHGRGDIDKLRGGAR
jgi:hypothetical protein